jgi:hypothetical protein
MLRQAKTEYQKLVSASTSLPVVAQK